MLIIGLTGSVAMGKTETAKIFEQYGIPRYNADEAVHALYEKGGEAVALIEKSFPSCIKDGAVDRTILAKLVFNDSDALTHLESLVYPLVFLSHQQFIHQHVESGTARVILDIPILLENKGYHHVDIVIVVSTSLDIQRRRFLSRPMMTEDKFQFILKRQMPDDEKRKKADFVIDTSLSIEDVQKQIRDILVILEKRNKA